MGAEGQAPSSGTPGEGGGGGSVDEVAPRNPLPSPPPEYRGRGNAEPALLRAQNVPLTWTAQVRNVRVDQDMLVLEMDQ